MRRGTHFTEPVAIRYLLDCGLNMIQAQHCIYELKIAYVQGRHKGSPVAVFPTMDVRSVALRSVQPKDLKPIDKYLTRQQKFSIAKKRSQNA